MRGRLGNSDTGLMPSSRSSPKAFQRWWRLTVETLFCRKLSFHVKFKGFANKIRHLLYTNKQYQYLLKITYLTFNALTLKEKRNRNSRGYIIKLGSDQRPDSNSAEKSHDTAHLGSQFVTESKLALLTTEAREMRG